MKKFRVTLFFTDGKVFVCEVEADDKHAVWKKQFQVLKEKLLGLGNYHIEEVKEKSNA
jgi:hypothetical protein